MSSAIVSSSTPAHHGAERLFAGQLAEEYAELARICPAAADASQRVGGFMAAWRPDETLTVLELGTGTGATAARLLDARANLAITGIDNEPAMLRQAGEFLASAVADGRLTLVEQDALSYLRGLASDSLDAAASAYTIHNFLNGYRDDVLREIFRVLKPGGLFVNADRYTLDDPADQLKEIQDEIRGYFRVFGEMARHDLLEQWIVHLASDESPHHRMPLGEALATMTGLGFADILVRHRAGVNALLTAVKP